jgi:hypothetical protein
LFNKKLPTVPAYCIGTAGGKESLVQIFPRSAGEETDFVKFPGLTFFLNKILVKVLEGGNADPNRSVPFLLLGRWFF